MGWKHLTTRFWRWKNMNALRWKLFGGTWWVCSRFFCKEEFFACAQKGSLCSPRSGASWGGEAAGMWKAHPWRAGNWAWSTGNPSIFLTRGLKGIHLPPFSIPLTHFKWNLLVRWWNVPGIPLLWCRMAAANPARGKLLNVVKRGRKKKVVLK